MVWHQTQRYYLDIILLRFCAEDGVKNQIIANGVKQQNAPNCPLVAMIQNTVIYQSFLTPHICLFRDESTLCTKIEIIPGFCKDS